MNVLLLSAGKRVELVNHFKRARSKEGVKGEIIAADMQDDAPAIYFSDKYYLVPAVLQREYIPTLLNLCKKEDIKLIIPTIDTELMVLAAHKKEFLSKGIQVLVSDKNVVEISADKYKTYQFFKRNNIKTPLSYVKIQEKNEYDFPLFIKPRYGNSSRSTFKINNMEELNFFFNYIEKPIVQQFIEGNEFTIDVFCDFQGNPIYITPRKRIAVKGGEITKGITVKDQKLMKLTEEILLKLKAIGPITLQCIKQEEEYYFIEINPRFGGGAPISIQAGADSPRGIYKLMKGEKLKKDYDVFEENLLALRYDQALYMSKTQIEGR